MKLDHAVFPDDVDLDAIDLTDSNLYAHGDPHSVWSAMRRRDPVRWQQVDDDRGFWSVTKFADVDLVLRDHTLFTSERGTMLFLLGKQDPAGGRQMAATDPPRQTSMREPLRRALTARNVEPYRDAIATAVRRLLAPALSGEPFDFARAMMALPMATASTMMGLPHEDWDHLTRLTAMAVAPDDPDFTEPGGANATLQHAHRQLFGYFHDVVRKRRRNSGDDLISLLMNTEIDGKKLDSGAVLSNCYGLILGANVTTPFVPTGAMSALAGTPALDLWRGDPSLFNSGVDEALRWSSPANHFMRHAVRDVELRGKTIRAGDAVVAWLGSANRDEEVFDAPFAFDVRRKPNRHLAFGSGPHYCVGHAVARMSLKVLFTELFESFDHFEIAGEVEHLHSHFVAGIKSMPMVMRPRHARLRRAEMLSC